MERTKNHYYVNDRPHLVVERARGRVAVAHCYSSTRVRVTSLGRLSERELRGLFSLGLLACGQEFRIVSRCDGSEPPAGHDEVPCVAFDAATGARLAGPAINPYSQEPYAPARVPYYSYECEVRCDSSG